jgi:ParB family chromosome partitioning protein
MGHARAIINIEDVDKQLDVFNKILKEDLSVRKVEALVRELTSGESKEKDKTSKVEMPYEAKQVQSKLSSHFGTKVGMKIDKNNKGEIKIPFLSKDDLNRILDILSVEL